MELIKKLRVPIAIVLAGVFLGQLLVPVSANEKLDALRRQQQNISREIKEQEKQIQQKTSEIRDVSTDINKLERTIDNVKRDINSLKKRLNDTENMVTIAEGELAEAEARFDERTDVLATRVREIFINGQVNYLEVIFQATSINDLLTRMVLLEKLMEQDMLLLNEIEAERIAIEEKKAALEKKRADIVAIKLETEQKEKELLAKTRERQQWLASLQTDRKALEKALDELEETSNRIAEQIRREQAKNSKGSGIVGKGAWPTPGYTRVSSDYGMRLHPILRSQRMHTGIDIAAPSGVNIVAVDNGRVIYADWLGGYGKTVIIDHGKGLSTLYAHQSSILVKVGDEVIRGDVIGKIGSTGQSTGPHLHFEVRKDGAHTNPWPFLR